MCRYLAAQSVRPLIVRGIFCASTDPVRLRIDEIDAEIMGGALATMFGLIKVFGGFSDLACTGSFASVP